MAHLEQHEDPAEDEREDLCAFLHEHPRAHTTDGAEAQLVEVDGGLGRGRQRWRGFRGWGRSGFYARCGYQRFLNTVPKRY